MPQTIETVKESRWREGKRFIYLENIENLAAGASENILICVGENDSIIESMSIESNAESLSWEVFGGVVATSGTGTILKPIPRNSRAATKQAQTITANPTISGAGVSFTGYALNLVAQIFRNNQYYLKDDLFSSDFVLQKNACFLIRVNNTSSDPVDVQLSIDTANT